MCYQGIEVTRQWDGYLTVTAKVAAAISINGRVPKHGYENRTGLTQVDSIGTTRAVWVGRTTYGGVEHYWLN